jgi:glycerophosphoryl diester phosphodiesterase
MKGLKQLKRLAPILIPVVALAGVIGYVAWRTRRIPTPRRKWKQFDHPEAAPLNASVCNNLQGIYAIREGIDFFGRTAVLKYSYTVEKEERIHHLSLFCEKNGTYMLCEGRQRGNDILVKGHWRKASSNGTGLVWLVIENGMKSLAANNGQAPLRLNGTFGDDSQLPRKPLSLLFQEPLPEVPPFAILGHRGGGRNVDFLSISENTTGMIKLAAQLGANGIEIDVRMTKDNVPVIFHDSFFSIHTVQDVVYGGLLHNHTLAEVKQLELRNEGNIPTLEEILHTVLYQTPLEFVWLDIKKECDLQQVHRLQTDYHQRAASINRKLTIYIGIPDEYILKCFKALEGYRDIPCLTELDYNVVLDINAQVWAPQYTSGFQAEEVKKVQDAGKKAWVWSLDAELMVETYVSEGGFDGLVTNTAPVVAHWLYTKHSKAGRQTSPVTNVLLLLVTLLFSVI